MEAKDQKHSAIAADAEEHLYRATKALEALRSRIFEERDGDPWGELWSAATETASNPGLATLVAELFFKVRGLRMTFAQLEKDFETAPITAPPSIASTAVPADEPICGNALLIDDDGTQVFCVLSPGHAGGHRVQHLEWTDDDAADLAKPYEGHSHKHETTAAADACTDQLCRLGSFARAQEGRSCRGCGAELRTVAEHREGFCTACLRASDPTPLPESQPTPETAPASHASPAESKANGPHTREAPHGDREGTAPAAPMNSSDRRDGGAR